MPGVPVEVTEAAARDLLESDAMTGAGGDTPTHYIVDPENVEYLVSTIVTAAVPVLRETWEAPIRAIIEQIEARHTKGEPVELMLHHAGVEPCEKCSDGEGHLVPVCDGCYPTYDDMPGHAVWPCLEAKSAAALRALLASEATS